MPTFGKFQPIFILMITPDENDVVARQGSQNRGAFRQCKPAIHVLPGMEAIPDDRDNVRLMLGQRFAQVSIKLTVLVQIRRR